MKTAYPFKLRNRIPWFARGLTLFFFGVATVGMYLAFTDAPAGDEDLVKWIMPVFWLFGVQALRWSMNIEAANVTVNSPGRIIVTAGPAFRRVSIRSDTAQTSIEQSRDDEGDPYYKLVLHAQDRPIVIAEGHYVQTLEDLRSQLQQAVDGA